MWKTRSPPAFSMSFIHCIPKIESTQADCAGEGFTKACCMCSWSLSFSNVVKSSKAPNLESRWVQSQACPRSSSSKDFERRTTYEAQAISARCTKVKHFHGLPAASMLRVFKKLAEFTLCKTLRSPSISKTLPV